MEMTHLTELGKELVLAMFVQGWFVTTVGVDPQVNVAVRNPRKVQGTTFPLVMLEQDALDVYLAEIIQDLVDNHGLVWSLGDGD